MQIDSDHIFQGEVQGKKNRPSGYHSTASNHPYARPVGGKLQEDPHSHIYSQNVEMRKPSNNIWRPKRQPSTFFPDDFSQNKVERYLQRAHTIEQQSGQNPAPVQFRRFADTREESGGVMKIQVSQNGGKLRGYPVF